MAQQNSTKTTRYKFSFGRGESSEVVKSVTDLDSASKILRLAQTKSRQANTVDIKAFWDGVSSAVGEKHAAYLDALVATLEVD